MEDAGWESVSTAMTRGAPGVLGPYGVLDIIFLGKEKRLTFKVVFYCTWPVFFSHVTRQETWIKIVAKMRSSKKYMQ